MVRRVRATERITRHSNQYETIDNEKRQVVSPILPPTRVSFVLSPSPSVPSSYAYLRIQHRDLSDLIGVPIIVGRDDFLLYSGVIKTILLQ